MRDVASMHSSFRKVHETGPATEHVGEVLAAIGVSECIWYLDRPVSNSGRIRKLILDLACRRSLPWRVEIVADPDRVLSDSHAVVATADRVIIDRCEKWVNLARHVVTTCVPGAWAINLGGSHA